MSERLSRILKANGVEAPKIHAAYLIKIGGVLIESSQVDSDSSNDSGDEASKRETSFSRMYEEIIRALNKHPNIFEVKPFGDTHGDVVRFTSKGLILRGSPVKLHINLPIAVQKFSATHWVTKPAESFDIIMKGSLFAAYMQISDWPHFTYIAQEFRELFREHINSTTQYKVLNLGPTPIHLDLYLVLLDQSTLPPKSTPIFEADNDLFILAPGDVDVEKIVVGIMTSMQWPLALFYSAMVEREEVMVLTEEIHNSFMRLLNFRQQHQEAKWYHLPKRVHLDKQASDQISHLYEAIFTAQAAQFDYDQSRREVRDGVTAAPLLAPAVKYFADSLEDVLVIPESLFPALDHFAAHVRSATGTRIAVIASLIGAAVGALLKAMLTH
jgi:hypothetical protein